MRRSTRLGCGNLARFLALAAGLSASPGVAAETPPSHPPVPLARPLAPAGTSNPARPPADTAVPEPRPAEAGPPVPEKRPAPSADETPSSPAASSNPKPAATGKAEEEGPAVTGGVAEGSKPVPVPGIAEDGDALAACYKRLDAMGVTYVRKGTVNDAGRCGMEAPVSVTDILPGVTLEPAAEMRCATALALARWTKRVVEPAAEELGSNVHLTGLSQGSAYVCKHRDGNPDRKISQHAFGNAVDIVTFRFAGHAPLSIAPRRRTGRIEEGFQRAVIGGACLYFTTVLGPRADDFHKDNLHLDIDRRSHGFRLCQ